MDIYDCQKRVDDSQEYTISSKAIHCKANSRQKHNQSKHLHFLSSYFIARFTLTSALRSAGVIQLGRICFSYFR